MQHESAGKKKGVGGKKIGNAHLKWAFGEAACLMLRMLPAGEGVDAAAGEEARQAQGPAILEAKIGRAVYHLWRKQRPFDAKKFLAS